MRSCKGVIWEYRLEHADYDAVDRTLLCFPCAAGYLAVSDLAWEKYWKNT